MSRLSLLVVLLCVCGAVCDDVGTLLQGRILMPPKVFRKGAGVGVVVNGDHWTYVRQNGSFLLDLPPGTHIIDFAVREFIMPQLRVDISRKTPGKYRVAFNDKERHALPEPLEIEPIAQVSYFEPKEETSYTKMLFGNPMMLMMLVVGGMAFVMPMLVDPEEMKQMKKQNPGGLMEMLKNAANEANQPQQPQAPVQRKAPRAVKK
eukprot:TRINITY_DN43506_c0_g1_i1.p1 TRINITY_DN43506_c0_g1~~TRINITY_DN43506_c0_g1_i1.p1  ORF type:complete len:223 (+),score=71.16 TRINITY_DN43506_c0_g1_i1:55-669(+)